MDRPIRTDKKRETIGKISTELQLKASGNTHSAEDQMRENLTEYDSNIYECVQRSRKEFMGDFFVVVLTKKERLMPNVIRNYFYSRLSCPTPDYDQTVYRYLKGEDMIEFMWVIPSKDTCEYLKQNALMIDPSEHELLNFVLSFYDGSLLKLCKSLNNETEKTGQLLLGV